MSFELAPTGEMPGGWRGGPPGTVFADEKIVHGGRWSVRIERHRDSPNDFSAITKSIPIDFSGATVELRGFLRTEDVSEFAGLWLREDDESTAVAFDNMQSRHLNGTSDWTEYSIALPVRPEARKLFFGVLSVGTGTTRADDLQLLVDGKPVWDAPRRVMATTIIDRDHQFDNGSGIVIDKLTEIQVDNLAILGKLWGFLKYYHPRVTGGQLQWDYELFRILPSILSANDHSTARAALEKWVANLGTIEPCKPCASLYESDLDLHPDLDWISNEALLGADLSGALRSIRENRLPGKQFYENAIYR